MIIKRQLIGLISLLLVFAMTLPGCAFLPGVKPPLIVNFSSAPGIISRGSQSTLIWNVTDATSVRIEPGIGNVALSGTMSVTPNETTTYILTAIGSGGSTINTVTITVNQTPPVIVNFTVSPSAITSGQSSNLSWNVTGVDTVTISPAIGSKNASGNLTVNPITTTSYVLIAGNSGGTVTATAILTVNPAYTTPVSNSFHISPNTVFPGGIATMYWDVKGATSVRIDPGIGEVPTSGSRLIYPETSTTYILLANNAECNCVITDYATVEVYEGFGLPYYFYPPYYPPYSPQQYGNRPQVVSFYSSPPIIRPDEAAVLQWNVTGASSVFIASIGSVATSGSITLNPTVTTFYTLTATNAYGSTTASLTVTVLANIPAATPVINYFFANPVSITNGRTSTLSWSVTGATSVSISQGIGIVPLMGTRGVSPNLSRTYVLTASNSAGMVQQTVTVRVED
jgi:hypothetical protein